MTKKQDEPMETVEKLQAQIIQGERDTNLTSLLFITRELGKLEGISSAHAVPDQRITSVKDDFLRLYESLIEKVGLSESMRMQDQQLEKNHFDHDHY